MSENIPAKARIEGVDLVTEGVITLRALVELGERYPAGAAAVSFF